MAKKQLLSKLVSVRDAQDNLLSGGRIFVREPGTNTNSVSFTSSSLSTANTNPVILDANGRAEIWVNTSVDLRVENADGDLVFTETGLNADDDSEEFDSGLIANGSFESLTANNIATGWTITGESGSTNGVDTTQSTDGGHSFRFTSNGNGGGTLETTNFFNVNDVNPLRVNFDIYSTIASAKNIIAVDWYTINHELIDFTEVYNSENNPTVFTPYQTSATPPPGARFAKLVIVGIDSTVPISASTYVDRIVVFYNLNESGVFGNITIQDNEIISTNSNGEIDINPDDGGSVLLRFNQAVQAQTSPVGGLEANNLITGGGLERVLTESDLVEAATQAEVDAGTESTKFVTPETLESKAGGSSNFFVRSTTDYDVSSNTIHLNDPQLFIPSLPVGIYTFDALIRWRQQSASSQGISCDFTFLSGGGFGSYLMLASSAASGTQDDVTSKSGSLGTDFEYFISSTSTDLYIVVRGEFEVTVPNSSFTFRFAQRSSNVNATRRLPRSWIRVTAV